MGIIVALTIVGLMKCNKSWLNAGSTGNERLEIRALSSWGLFNSFEELCCKWGVRKWGGILKEMQWVWVLFKDRGNYSILYANKNDLEGGEIDEASVKGEWLEPVRMVSSGQVERVT